MQALRPKIEDTPHRSRGVVPAACRARARHNMACDDRPICFCQPDDTEEKWDDEYGRYDGHVIEGELDAHLVVAVADSSVSVVEDCAALECADDARAGAVLALPPEASARLRPRARGAARGVIIRPPLT